MLCGLVIVPIVSLITPKLPKDKVDEMFTCYNREVVVKASEDLGDKEND